MKKKLLLAALFAGLMGFGQATTVQAEEVSVSGDIGAFNQYVWRGVAQNGSKAAVQGDLGVSYGGFSASVWFSNSYPSPEPQFAGKDVVEFDWTADYSGSVGDSGLGYSLGAIYYTYLYDAHSNFVELYGGVSYDAAISPSMTVYYTAKGNDSGFYKTGDLWVDFGLSGSVGGFDLSATGSYVNWKADAVKRPIVAGLDMYKNGVAVVALGMSKDVTAGDVTITPSVTVTIPTVSKSIDGNQYIYGTAVKTEFIAGVNFAY